jgi:YggT family protein
METGGAEGIRTPDLRSAIAALSQLSYSPAGPSDVEWAANEWGHLRPGSASVKDGGLFARRRPATPAHRSIPGFPMAALFLVIKLALQIYIWLLIAAAILSWLIAFNVVNTRNQVVSMVGDFLYRITEPVLRPIRNLMPDLGGIDISPVILILIIIFIQYVIDLYILPNVY